MLAAQEDVLEIQKELNGKIQENFFEKKEIVIFGCTMYARNIRDFLEDKGIKVTAFIDNNKTKSKNLCLGIKIYKPEEYLMPFRNNAVIIVCSKYYDEMIHQLKQMGYGNAQIVNIMVSECKVGILDAETFFEENFHEVIEGYQLYQELKAEEYAQSRLLLCPYQGTGDVYMACLFLQNYLEENHIKDYVLLVIGNNCKKVTELFSIPYVFVMIKEESERLLKAWEFLGSEKVDLYPLLYWGWRTKRYLYADKFPQITFTEMFRYDVFGFSDDIPMTLPVKRESAYAEKLFQKLRLRKGKTIIIAPYAGSFVSDIPMTEWEELVIELKKKGYDVCTNCYGKKEMPIKGTIPIQFSYSEVCNVLEYAGGFIAVRSGLCDIASPAECTMIVLYEGGFNASRYEYFSLKKMGLNHGANELIYCNNLLKVFDIL